MSKICKPNQVSDLMSQDIKTVETASDRLIGNQELYEKIYSQPPQLGIVVENILR